MNWDLLYNQGIDVEDISGDSEEYEIMFFAAADGNPTAQYCLGLWAEKVDKEPEIALIWLKKAARQNFKEAIEELHRLESEQGVKTESFFRRKRLEKAFEAESQQSDSEQSATPESTTSEEANIIRQRLKKALEEVLQQAVNEQGVVSESTTSEEANINRQPTSLSIQEHNFQVAKNSLKVYTEKAKKDIELSPVRTGSWFFNLGSHMVTGEEFNERLSQIESYFIELNNLNQGLIDEFGEVYEAFEALDKDYISGIVASIKAAEKVSKDEQKDRADIKKLVKQHQDSIEVLKKFKKDIDRLNHLTDIDKAWELIEDQVKLSKELSELIDELSTTVRDQESAINKIKNEQKDEQKDRADIKKLVEQHQDSIEVLKKFKKDIDRLNHLTDIDKAWELIEDQVKISKNLSKHIDELSTTVRDQESAINKIEIEQKEKFDELLETQSLTLEKIADEQLDKVCQFLEDEKNAISEQVTVLTQKVKLSYVIAGSAVALAVVQLLLNILGVF